MIHCEVFYCSCTIFISLCSFPSFLSSPFFPFLLSNIVELVLWSIKSRIHDLMVSDNISHIDRPLLFRVKWICIVDCIVYKNGFTQPSSFISLLC